MLLKIITLKYFIAHVSTKQSTHGADYIYQLSEIKGFIEVMNSENQLCSTL